MQTERLPGYDRFVGRWPEQDHRRAMAGPDHIYLIGMAGDAPAGFVMLKDVTEPHGNVCLKRIAVAAPGQGFGHRFLAAVVDWIFANTATYRLWLDVAVTNSRARHVYERQGFHLEGTMRQAFDRPDGRIDLLLMSLLRPDWTAR